MTTEEKAKAYDEALKEAVVAHKDEDKHLKATLERIFPELKESEDERIKKSIIEHLKCDIDDMAKSDNAFEYEAEIEELSKYIAWLEKQQKPVISDNALREGIAHFGITQYQIDNWLKKYVDIEKQGEQKPADKVEPKFEKE